MEAIKTKFNGVEYRSKLEARWAVFFFHYGVRFEYEPTTFKLKSGLYCPDFYFPDLACYAEVKPLISEFEFLEGCSGYQKFTFFESIVYLKPEEYRKIQEFEESIVLLCGLPLEKNFILFNTVDLDCWNGFNCYPVLDKNGWRWWSSTQLNDYPDTCKIKECSEIARYYDFFKF